jgi:hypothetical protein
MTIGEIEELIRRYISTGFAVVMVLVAPGAKIDETALPSGSQVVTVAPSRPAPSRPAPSTSTRPTPAPDSGGTGDRTGTGGADPGAEDPQESGQLPPDSGAGAGDGSGAEAGSGNASESDSHSDSGSGSDREGPRSGSGNDSGPAGAGSAGSRSGGEGNAGSSASGSGSGPGSDGSDPASGSDAGSATGSDGDSGGDAAQSSATGSPSSTSDGATAAATLGWGSPEREDDFSSGDGQWSIYDGAGHGGQGKRSPSAVSTTGGVLTLTGDPSGTTAGMAWNPGRKYGRWEGRVRAPAGDPSYNALLLLWPDAEDWPSGGEVDFMEMSDPSRQETNMFLHYGADNQQLNGKVQVDATQWHNWAVEWTPDAITAYVDGREWFRTTDKSTFPPGPMHLCIQLDWFPQGGDAKESTMQVDWVRPYPVGGGSTEAAGSAGDGTDQPAGVRNLLRRMFSWG